jgi:8-oxo-dGTP pyrophosphatase MutT (NUDIX family)
MKTERLGGARPHLSAGVVVVRQTASGWRFLMLRAYRNWDFPKGLVESGEDPLSAARREVTEETLISDLNFAWGEVYIETAPYSRNKVARYYIAQTSSEAVTCPYGPSWVARSTTSAAGSTTTRRSSWPRLAWSRC